MPVSAICDVPELFRLVLEEFRTDRPMLLQISLVCRSFWEGVIPMLWEVVPERHTTHQVVKTFPLHQPFDIVKPKGKHWVEVSSEARYALYATYVKAMTFKTPKRRDNRLFDLLHSKPLAKIFPKLRSLSFVLLHLPDDNEAFFRDAINGLELREFRIEFGGALTNYDLSPAISSIIPQLRPCHGELRSFTLIPPSPLSIQETQVIEITFFIATLPRLVYLEFENLETDFVEHWKIASQMPRLESVLLDGKFQFAEDVTFPPDGFERAKFVRLVSVPAHSVHKLLESIQSTRLQRLDLYVQTSKSHEVGEAAVGPNLVEITRFTGTLRTLRLNLGRAVVRWDDLQLLLSCHELETVSLTLFKSVIFLTDDYIKLMAKAWRGLTSLKIDDPMLEETAANVRQWTYPVATLRGLTSLAKYCPHLESIRISVWAKDVGTRDPNHVGLKVKHVDLLWSVAHTGYDHNRRRAAESFVAKMWPHRKKNPNQKLKWNGVNGDQEGNWLGILDIVPRYGHAVIYPPAPPTRFRNEVVRYGAV